jgi:hypothetical protein
MIQNKGAKTLRKLSIRKSTGSQSEHNGNHSAKAGWPVFSLQYSFDDPEVAQTQAATFNGGSVGRMTEALAEVSVISSCS